MYLKSTSDFFKLQFTLISVNGWYLWMWMVKLNRIGLIITEVMFYQVTRELENVYTLSNICRVLYKRSVSFVDGEEYSIYLNAPCNFQNTFSEYMFSDDRVLFLYNWHLLVIFPGLWRLHSTLLHRIPTNRNT